ncbi:MAG: hypothetical protein A2826_02890 [Candidatus Doudnabacteria bacterium RIFCSPHIGHO2_01_FULL_43_23]|uniref:Response regulatory domain-containing protein n=1 Tax=Candidatus Doudnabacteria bacterium RIFCSPHIGHO2_01_FULL_43_23 TaxID=1817822 RepID=A0A1F5NRW7_9BACT|nr:MAG: hypothetical protein A2826_02890 [Candidatus Doudnabacteria bacterium RIFCSPHIGHO2_01_FULL_43_23]
MILLVDSDQIWQEIISRHLLAAELSYTICDTGISAKEYLNESTPDLIIMEISLPDMPGTVLLKNIREDSLVSSVPVLILTNSEETEDISLTLEYGASDYLLKSDIDFRHLISRINILKK